MKKMSHLLKSHLVMYLLIIICAAITSFICQQIAGSMLYRYENNSFFNLIPLVFLALSFSFSTASLGYFFYISFHNKSGKQLLTEFLIIILLSFFLQIIISGGTDWGTIILFFVFSPISIIPSIIVGYSLGILAKLIFKKQTLKKNTLRQTLLVTVCFAFLMTFTSGIFFSSKITESYNEKNHYYIHRGVPFNFIGVTAVDKSIPNYIIKVPFTIADNNKIQALIDLGNLFKSIAFYSFILFIPSFLISQKKNSKLELITYGSVYILLLSYVLFFSLSSY